MRYAINVPNFGEYADARFTAGMARCAEEAGWDGFFVWDHINAAMGPGMAMGDPWVILTAVALATEQIRIGTMVTPLPRRRPWKLARETTTLDHLSRGRMILGVGLGIPADAEFAAFGEDPDTGVRARRLDEGLEVLTGLWSGEPFSFAGEHYEVREVQFAPTALQRPRIPIWVAQSMPHRRPLRRAARWDGLVPIDETAMFASPAQVAAAVAEVKAMRPEAAAFDVNVSLLANPDPVASRDLAAEYEAAGATWIQYGAFGAEAVRAAIEAGPPR